MIEKDDNVVVYSHMSDTELRNIINERKHLSPERAKSLLKRLEITLSELSPHEIFEKSYEVYHTKEAIFYSIGYGRPDPYFDLVFLNNKFIVYVYMGSNYVKFDFRDNINIPTEFDKQEVVRQLFDMFDNFDVWWSMLLLEENPVIEFEGV